MRRHSSREFPPSFLIEAPTRFKKGKGGAGGWRKWWGVYSVISGNDPLLARSVLTLRGEKWRSQWDIDHYIWERSFSRRISELHTWTRTMLTSRAAVDIDWLKKKVLCKLIIEVWIDGDDRLIVLKDRSNCESVDIYSMQPTTFLPF